VKQEAIQQLKANKSIVIRKADKGNVTVIMKKEEYFNKLKKLVDSSEYEVIKSNPTSCLERKVNEALKLKEIKKYTRLELAPRYCKAPHIYGLPKIHKADVPLRPIVSSIGSPSHDLAKYLVKIINPVLGTSTSFVKNSTEFVKEIQGKDIDQRHLIVSFDVTSLFTNVPTNEALLATKAKLSADKTLKKRTKHSVATLMNLITLCIKNTYFEFNGSFYKQKNGLAMGCPLSPALSDIYLEELEKKALKSSVKKPVMYKRYVDDVFIIWPQNEAPVESFLEHMNN
jgi:hypothetical protein